MDAGKLKQGLNNFGWSLYRSLSGQGNVIVSPHSVSSALMLACLGAKGETESQILASMGATGEGSAKAHELYKGVNDSLAKETSENEGVEFSIANKLYAKNSMEITETFLKDSTGYYGNTTDKMDFGQNPEECRKAINDWVEEQTKQKIKDLLPGGTITPMTNLVLVNAIYFKGKWEKPFKTERTEKADFYISASDTVKVDMMHANLKLPFVADEELKCSAVSIPYQSSGISMVIVLPDQVDGLSELEQKLTSERFLSFCDDARAGFKGNIELGLPKFSMTETSELSKILPKLGMTDLFDSAKADLSGLTLEANVAINDVIHKAHIEVNEEGTEAAAATAMISRMMLMPMEDRKFVCDKPFLFVLSDQTTGAPLFLGRYSKPV